MLGDGKFLPVGFYGDLDLGLHCEQDVRVTLTNVVVVPGLAFDILSFNRMQERHEIILNQAGTSMLGGRVRFKTFRAGNFIQAARRSCDTSFYLRLRAMSLGTTQKHHESFQAGLRE